ncbi:MAG: dienelactone hydrolase family protein [Candidatus Methylomirabilales bacterium]
MFRGAAAALLTVFLMAGCASLGVNQTAELARTWDGARVYLPGSGVGRLMADFNPSSVPAPRPLPTVLYLHGCTGIYGGSVPAAWARFLNTAGYAVVMPDSFAREYRPRNCHPATRTGGLFPPAHDMRLDEIEYALVKLRTLPWVDQRNLFLMGHSEGGIAAARWPGRGFNGHIISGWTCTHLYDPFLDGLRAARETPVLVLEFEDDPWHGRATAGSCGTKFGGRKDARLVTLPGRGHYTGHRPEAREAVLQFLRDHTVRD